ncbi:unnamed protein product [Musa acuminata var. zebrina]
MIRPRSSDAIKDAGGHIKSLAFPSEFGIDVARNNAVEPAKSTFAGATDLPTDKVVILGDGNPKGNLFLKHILIELTVRNANWVVLFPSTAIFLNEDDIGTYTIKAVDDPRTLNKVLYLRPPANILSHNELVSLWEKKTGKTFERVYVPEEHVLKQIQGVLDTPLHPLPVNVMLAICHSAFVKGDHVFDIEPSFGVEASELYPDVKY